MFQKGIEDGIIWHFHGETPGRPMTEEDVINFLKGNFIELALEGYLDQERLRSNAGFLIGWLGAQAHLRVSSAFTGFIEKRRERPLIVGVRGETRC